MPNENTQKVRVSIGTAQVLGLTRLRANVAPTTAYLMSYHNSKCIANCAFCPQARDSTSDLDLLSRIIWPIYSIKDVLPKLASAFENKKLYRVCIQSLNFLGFFEYLSDLVKKITEISKIPISVSCQPMNLDQIKKLKDLGVDRLGIPIDAVTKEIFNRIKGNEVNGPYSWEKVLKTLNGAVKIFGNKKISTHIIIGLGESEKETLRTIQRVFDMNVIPGLFAFTPVEGTALENLERPSPEKYRKIQLGRHLIVNRKIKFEEMSFDRYGNIIDFGVPSDELHMYIETGIPFMTTGCPHCNRPFYTESPRGPIYNYPTSLSEKDIEQIKNQIKI